MVRRKLRPWLAERPSVALFFDNDGTLTPLVERPEKAVLSARARGILRQATRTPNLDVAIVSGRSLDDVKRMVDLPGLAYVGIHGFEIDGPGIRSRHEDLARFEKVVDRAALDLAKIRHDGVWRERRGATLSVHFRQAAASRWASLRS